MIESTGIAGVSHIIQLSIAPAFLLVGIGHLLVVMTNRLARITDRARALELDFDPEGQDMARNAPILQELAVLERRMALSHWSISLCTFSALLLCIVVMMLFLSDALDFGFGLPVVGLFIATMSALIAGLVLFLIEISLATRHVRVRRDLLHRG